MSDAENAKQLSKGDNKLAYQRDQHARNHGW
jgi:hypothetical protein